MYTIETIKDKILTWNTIEVTEQMWKDHINSDFARDIFLFLYDYTNSFKNANTTSDILILAWKTLEFGINHDKLIVEKIKKSFSQMKLCSEALENTNLYNEWSTIGTYVSLEMKKRHKNEFCIAESFINNILVTVSGTRLCFFVNEIENWVYAVKLESKDDKIDIQRLKNKLLINEKNISEIHNLDSIIETIISFK